MGDPAVSVAMVVCNVERFLAEAIESVLAQTFTDFEFIIVDSGSTDGSRSIAASYAARDSRIRLHDIPNCSLPEARNAGCYLARGRYIAIMDADDICRPERFQWEIDFMERHPRVGVLGGAVDWIDGRGRLLCTNYFPTENQEIQSDMMTHCTFSHPTIVVRKDAFLSVGGYRTAFAFAHDYDLILRIADNFECAILDQVVLKYRIHPYQVTMRRQRVQTLCKLAAQISASSRRAGKPDPLQGVLEITPALLSELGVNAAEQQNFLASDCRNWIRSMSMAREYQAGIDAGTGLLQSGWKHVSSWQIADLHLTMARFYWKQGKPFRSALSVCRAIATRPLVVGRPMKLLLRRVGGA